MGPYYVCLWTLLLPFIFCNFQKTYGQRCDGGVTVNGICYSIVLTQRNTWNSANDYCRQIKGHLASINNADVQNAIANLVRGRPSKERVITGLWIGARESINTFNDRIWRWTRSGSIIGPQGCYRDDISRDLPYMPDPMLTRDPVSCINTCRNLQFTYAGLQNGNLCFCGNSTFGQYGTASKCDVECTVTTTPIKKCGGVSQNFIYDVRGSYAQWGHLQPNNLNQYQRCGVIDRFLEYKFSDESCRNMYPYICEINNMASCTGSDSTGWYYQGQLTSNCYYVSRDELSAHLSWFLASEKCKSLGGYLVEMPGTSILQSDEHTEIKQILTNSWSVTSPIPSSGVKLWIGLTKSGWTWSTGEAFEYTNWNAEEPNSNTQYCAMMNSTMEWMWSDENCNTYSYFVCQGGEITTTTTTSTSTTTVTSSSSTSSESPSGGNSQATPVAGASSTGALTNEEIVVLVVLLVLFIIAIIVLVLICVYCCTKDKRKVHSTKTYEKHVPAPSDISRTSSSEHSSNFIDINDQTDFYSGQGYQYRY